ncbi:MAG: hypothetical protein R2942_04910 [Ignavibacteria bacterium]|nr:hypothetical protein [Ignavibacteriota bacterium]
MIKKYFLLILISVSVFISCNKENDQDQGNGSSGENKWKSELKIEDIPDTPIKGYLNGKEIKIEYMNFETWRGSGDNVLNFGDVIPKNKCGFIETDNSFHLIHKGGEIKTGELLKANFDQTLDGYSAFYIVNGEAKDKKVTMQWNCALVISEINEKTVKGKILMCFKDDAKNRIAGSFEAIRCNN